MSMMKQSWGVLLLVSLWACSSSESGQSSGAGAAGAASGQSGAGAGAGGGSSTNGALYPSDCDASLAMKALSFQQGSLTKYDHDAPTELCSAMQTLDGDVVAGADPMLVRGSEEALVATFSKGVLTAIDGVPCQPLAPGEYSVQATCIARYLCGCCPFEVESPTKAARGGVRVLTRLTCFIEQEKRSPPRNYAGTIYYVGGHVELPKPVDPRDSDRCKSCNAACRGIPGCSCCKECSVGCFN